MAGDREAAGAIAGMQSIYGRPLPSIGQWVRGECRGRTFSGEVVEAEPGVVVVQIDEMQIVVPPSAIED
jgi:hypothetical protein